MDLPDLTGAAWTDGDLDAQVEQISRAWADASGRQAVTDTEILTALEGV